jgi:hypothetical protein
MPVFGQYNTANYAVRDRVNHDLAGDASPHQRGGKLVTSSGLNFLGTIHEASAGTTDVLNTTNAVEEVFHRSTGVLDLLNKADIDVAEQGRAAQPALYPFRLPACMAVSAASSSFRATASHVKYRAHAC